MISTGVVPSITRKSDPVTIASVPIEIATSEQLHATGKPTLDKALHYYVPAFNSTTQTLSDATAHFDPADLRGLGPSRTLVLINGKRKNPSALVYLNDTPGKGEVAFDWKSIPLHAIERIEILRDGASAQYGSDAIAGVINIQLKQDTTSEVYGYSGLAQTEDEFGVDGFRYGYNFNAGLKIGKGGFFNLHTSFWEQRETNRPGRVSVDSLFLPTASEDLEWVADNPSLGVRYGLPNTTTTNILYNLELPLKGVGGKADSLSFYSFGNQSIRKGISYALYRAPYWVPDPNNLFHSDSEPYQGFQPTFEADIQDRSLTAGVRSNHIIDERIRPDSWNYDVSYTFGQSDIEYIIGNTMNPELGILSPTVFNAGGYGLTQDVVNTNLEYKLQLGNRGSQNRRSNIIKRRYLEIDIGGEFRSESFSARAGDSDSYQGEGSISFPGIRPENALKRRRYNLGTYADMLFDVTEDFQLNGAIRYEDYSDFGENISWKGSFRWKVPRRILRENTPNDIFLLRASVSTGFRAPSLHQSYLSIIQTLVSGQSISNQGTFNQENPVLRELEVGDLQEETSFNIAAGIAISPSNYFRVELDGYYIRLNDRVVFSSSIEDNTIGSPISQLLDRFSITSLKFFANAVDTETLGGDLSLLYSIPLNGLNNPINQKTLDFRLKGSINISEIEGEIETPQILVESGIELFDRKEQSRILSSRPQEQFLLSTTYSEREWRIGLTGTYFGSVAWQHASDETKDQTFGAKVLADLFISYYPKPNALGFTLGVNNLLDTYPDRIDPKGDPLTNLGGRLSYPWEVNQFGFMGRNGLLTVHVRF